MIKTKTTVFLLCLASFQTSLAVENETEIFKKVFGDRKDFRYVSLPAFFKEKYLGEINVGIKDDKIINYSGSSLIQVLKLVLEEKEIKKLIDLKKEKYENSDFNFKIDYSSAELKLQLNIPENLVRPNESLFQEDLIPYFAKDAIRPSPFGGAINWKVEKSISEHDSIPTYTNLNFNSFFNFKNYVFENTTQYTSEQRPYWYRGTTTLSKDDEQNLVRYSMGDVSNSNVGYLATRSIGGISLVRDFDINPYRMNAPSGNTEFALDSRSLVRYYINNSLVKSEYLNAGKYSVKNIPLNNGINNIIVEVENEFGEKKIFNFKESFSSELLNRGDSKFDFTLGYLSDDQNNKKTYQTNKGLAGSGYFKRGWTEHFTNSLYAQKRTSYNMFGLENVLASKFGNWTLGSAYTKNSDNNGLAAYLGYSLTAFSSLLSNSQNLNVRLEKREKNFSDSFDFSISRFKYNLNSSYSVPITDIASLGLGAQYSIPYDTSLTNKYGIDLSVTGRLFKSSTITMFSSLIRDEFRNWNQYYYVFINISFPEKSTYVSAYYESQSQTKKISLYHDKGELINTLKVQSNIEETRYSKDGNLDLQYNTRYADLGVFQSLQKSNNQYSGRTNLKLLSSVLMASNGDGLKFGISRPTPSSFALFNQDKILKNQKIRIKNNDEIGDQTESSLDGKLVVNDLTPYQYRRIQLDPSLLKPGYSLQKESYIVFPTYKSAHLLNINSLGVVALRGRLLDSKGVPISLEVGRVVMDKGEEYSFFTNKVGRFFIESLKLGKGKLVFDNSKYQAIPFEITEKDIGILDWSDRRVQSNE